MEGINYDNSFNRFLNDELFMIYTYFWVELHDIKEYIKERLEPEELEMIEYANHSVFGG